MLILNRRRAAAFALYQSLAAVFLVATAAAQTRPEFEVASIRPSSEQPATAVNVGVAVNGSQARITAMSLKDYIGIAYRVMQQQIAGPEWLAQARFDIAAKLPDTAGAADQVPEMLQALLADRFQMQMHRESREFQVYAIVVGAGGPKLKESAATPGDVPPPATTQIAASGSGNGVGIDLGGGSSFSLGNNRIEARKMTMAELADMLTRFLDRPVVDATGLTARYDVTVALTQEDYLAMLVRSAVNAGVVLPPQALRILDGASGDRLAGPLQAVGLSMESRRAPLDVLVIDAMLKAPTAN